MVSDMIIENITYEQAIEISGKLELEGCYSNITGGGLSCENNMAIIERVLKDYPDTVLLDQKLSTQQGRLLLTLAEKSGEPLGDEFFK